MASKFALVLAASENFGIGYKNALPWPRIITDQKYFAEVTTKTSNSSVQNIAIMGRKTYESIPRKYRPLKDRINIVISQTLTTSPDEGVKLASSFEEALQISESLKQDGLAEYIYVVGGQQIYEIALRHPGCERIFYTKVFGTYESDTFFPNPDVLPDYHPVGEEKRCKILENYSCIPRPVENDVHENGVRYRFCIYDRI